MSAQLSAAKAARQSAKLALDSEIGGVNVTLTVGDRALQARSGMSFVVENEITIIGMFSQNGF